MTSSVLSSFVQPKWSPHRPGFSSPRWEDEDDAIALSASSLLIIFIFLVLCSLHISKSVIIYTMPLNFPIISMLYYYIIILYHFKN